MHEKKNHVVHKEGALVCEKGISNIKVINNFSLQNSKTILAQKPQIVLEKTWMYCTNFHKTNHNVETQKIKRKEKYILIVFNITT